MFKAFGTYNSGVEFFVDTEPEQAMMFVSARGNLSAPEKLVLVKKVEAVVLGIKGVKAAITDIGGSDGPSLSGGGGDTPSDQIGKITLEFDEFRKRRRGKVILQEIRDRTASMAGMVIEVRKVAKGPGRGKDVRLEVASDSFIESMQIARKIHKYVRENVKGLQDIEDSTPLPGIEWVLNVDRTEAGKFGTDIQSVGTMFQLVTNGVLIGKYRPNDSEDEVDIRLRLPEDLRGLDQFEQLRLQTPNGLVPVTNFVTREPKPKVSTITRTDGRYTMLVKANVPGGDKYAKIAEIQSWLDKQSWPANISFRFLGAGDEEKESGQFLVRAMIGALFLMFLILLTQFNSFYQTFITLSTIILSVVRVLLGMLITGQKFSIIMTGTGIVALAGVVVNNSIVLIDTFNRLKEDKNINILDAIIRSCTQRMRPIMLATITTMLGLLPMALQINMNFFAQTVEVGSITSIWWEYFRWLYSKFIDKKTPKGIQAAG